MTMLQELKAAKGKQVVVTIATTEATVAYGSGGEVVIKDVVKGKLVLADRKLKNTCLTVPVKAITKFTVFATPTNHKR